MTGTLFKLGQRITATLLGGDCFGWTPYLFLWMGLASGGLAGAVTFSRLGVNGLWIAAAVLAVAAVKWDRTCASPIWAPSSEAVQASLSLTT